MSLRIVFMGTPDFAVPSLSELVGQGHEIVAVYTREPSKAGRGQDVQLSPVHQQAQRFGLPVFTPPSPRSDEATALFNNHAADVAVVVAYGLILPEPILRAPRLGCLNLHGSLLPRWRGAAPLQRAIMAGDSETGVMIMQMEAGLDTGPVAMMERLPILPEMIFGELHDRLMGLGADLMVRALAALARGSLQFRPQAITGITYAAKISKAEARIDWSQPASVVHNHIRGLSPFPGAYFEADWGQGPVRVKVLRSQLADDRNRGEDIAAGTFLDEILTIACGEGAIRLIEVQRAGKAPMSAEMFQRGNKITPGLRVF